MILIGIDPGTATTGFGVVDKRGSQVVFIDCGVLTTPANMSAPARLSMLYTEFNLLLDTHKPDEVATERLFFNSNTTTAIPVGRALGVILLSLAQRDIPWTEYTPSQVKNAVVGEGRADKKQVQYMVTRLLSLKEAPWPDDAADALAVALCHAHTIRPPAPVRRVLRG